jgi:hypothetical protein
LRLARQLFQDLVAELISRVSFTDVSIYGQQKAPWEHNSQRPQN